MNTLAFSVNEEGIGILEINRPAALNALNSEVLGEMKSFLAELDTERVKGLIVTGSGPKAFVAGADIAEMSSLTQEEAETFGRKGNEVFRMLEKLPIPVIAAVNGYALGGGCELAMSCDLIICSEQAVFAQPETGLGIIPGFGGTHRLMKRVGLTAAKDMIYTGRRMKAAEAVERGLALKVVPADQLIDETAAYLRLILKNSRSAVAIAKEVLNEGPDYAEDNALDLESRSFGRCFTYPDQNARMMKFLKKS